jgi:mRNA interferase MazF
MVSINISAHSCTVASMNLSNNPFQYNSRTMINYVDSFMYSFTTNYMKETFTMENTTYQNTLHRGAVFYANLENDGTSRQSGLRPVVLVSNNLANRHSPVVVIVSLSSQIYKKKRLPVHCLLKASETGLKCDSLALCEQPLSIGKSQLLNYVCSLDDECMSRIDDCLRIQLCL